MSDKRSYCWRTGAAVCGLGMCVSGMASARADTTYVFRAQGIQTADTVRVRSADAIRVRLRGGGRGSQYDLGRSYAAWTIGVDNFEVRTKRPLRAFAYPEIERIQVSTGSHTAKGVVIGASVLAVAPLAIMVLGGVTAESGSSDVGFWPWFGSPLNLVAGGAAVGAIVGGVVGHHTNSWDTVYDRPTK